MQSQRALSSLSCFGLTGPSWYILESFVPFSFNLTSSSCAQSRWCSQGISQPLLWKYSCFCLPCCWRIVALYSSLHWLVLDGSFVVLAQTVQGFYIQALLIFAHVISQDEVAGFREILSLLPFAFWLCRLCVWRLSSDCPGVSCSSLARLCSRRLWRKSCWFSWYFVWPFLVGSFSLLECRTFVLTFAVLVLAGSFVVLA